MSEGVSPLKPGCSTGTEASALGDGARRDRGLERGTQAVVRTPMRLRSTLVTQCDWTESGPEDVQITDYH